MSSYIKVSPERLHEMAGEISSKVSQFSNMFGTISDVVKGTSGYWKGEAADKYRQLIIAENEDVTAVLKRLSGFVESLHSMGNIYEQTENEANDISEDLEQDVIF